ncbi:MAG: hypothetical protein ACREUR_01965 [Nitrosospira sp.]
MKKTAGRDTFGFTLAQFEDWAERSSQKMFKRYKKNQSRRIAAESGGKIIPISRKTRNRVRAD